MTAKVPDKEWERVNENPELKSVNLDTQYHLQK